ncbi:MAG: hypothetical protein ACYDGR_17060 [Candidatus Dormibacteria bacterium]
MRISFGSSPVAFISLTNMAGPGFTPDAAAREHPVTGAALPPLDPGESILAEEAGVVLGWQPRTIVIWWLPGVIFIGLSQFEFRSLPVTAGLTLFCVALFAFYAQDTEVRPRASHRAYVLTDRRVLLRSGINWRPVLIAEISRTHMEAGIADRAVARLSDAATIVLELRTPGPKGEARRVRIGPMRHPREFRSRLDAQLEGS